MSEQPPGGGYQQPPPGNYGQAGGTPPNNNLVMAIISIFCCWPLGIPAVVFAAQVNGKWQSGDAVGAQESATKARKFALWAIIAGVIITILYIVLVVILGVAGAGLSTTTSP